MVIVKLNADDLIHAAWVGAGRHISNRVLRKVDDPKHHPDGSTFDTDIIGAIGEKAVAKYLSARAPMRTILRKGASDVITAHGPVEVRSQRKKPAGQFLVIRKADAKSNTDTPFVLAVIPPDLDEAELLGWTTPRRVKEIGVPTAKMEGTPAKFVQVEDLWSMKTLREKLWKEK